MSTSGAMRVRGAGAGSRRPGTSYVYLAGSPRRERERRRSVLLSLASLAALAVLVPVGLQIHSPNADNTTADNTTAGGPLMAGNPISGQQGAPVINDAKPGQPPPEAGAIDPALSRALGKAQTAARKAGLDLQVTSGFRGAATQQRLYDQAIAKYGSPERARHWVLPPAESAHVKGLAVDVGPPAAAAWLEKHGVRYGLCRRYVNEGWHFERLAPAIGQPCPAMEPYAGG
jgi:D-alanyl-D-alanine carboxypeptidase